jgi:hypothetical protein
MENTNTQLAVITDESVELLRTAPEVLTANRERSAKIKDVAAKIISNWDIANAMPDGPEKDAKLAQIDVSSEQFVAKAKIGLKTSKENRAPYTQVMDMIKTYFTECENDVDITKKDTPVYLVQQKRNEYVTKLQKQKEEFERKLKLETAKKTEAIDIASEMAKVIVTKTAEIIANAKIKIAEFVNNTTLEKYEERLFTLQKYIVIPPTGEKLREVIGYPKLSILTNYHTEDEILIIQSKVLKDYDFTVFNATYQEQLLAIKSSKIDEMPSKYNELVAEKEAIEKAEKEKAEQEEQQRIAEEERQKQLAAAKSKQAKDALEKQQQLERDKEAENLRLQAEKAEEERQELENKKIEREKAEATRIEQERIANELQQKQAIEVDAIGEKTMELFNQEVESGAVTPNSKSTYRIEVSDAAGFGQIFMFWYEREGKTLTFDKIRKKSIEQMITFAQNVAKKSGEKIESKFLKYEIDISAK